MPEPDNELVKVRLQKLQRLRDRGIEPYPYRFDRTHTTREAILLLESRESAQDDDATNAEVTIAGRLVGFRGMGKVTFADLIDADGRIQVLFRRNIIADAYDVLRDLDIGDWLGATGFMLRTRTGESTLEAQSFTLLSKSVRPLPEKWHGLADVEIRFRQRYLDLIASEESRRIALMRSRMVSSLRHRMEDRGFVEVETPILVPVAAGAMASPFITHHNALDRDLYLRIATELYLKRLIVGGLEKVYEIGRVFRNEGVDLQHNPEFTMMESYEALADYTDVMQMVEEMVHGIAVDVLGAGVTNFGDHRIDFTPPWPRLSLREEIVKHSGIDFLELRDIESLKIAMRDAGVDVSQQASWGGLLDKLISSKVEPNLVQPSFLVDYPVEMSPLAKQKKDDPRLVERFEGFVAGMEICNAFTELNDPVEQRRRFEAQEALREQFEDEDMDRLDEDFLIAVEHGMPPTGGLGLGIDRLAMLLTDHPTIREVVLFPQLRSR